MYNWTLNENDLRGEKQLTIFWRKKKCYFPIMLEQLSSDNTIPMYWTYKNSQYVSSFLFLVYDYSKSVLVTVYKIFHVNYNTVS